MSVAILAKELFNGDLPLVSDISISSIEFDSRKVKQGSCFVAVKGFTVDGHDFVKEAVENGASIIVAQKDSRTEPSGVPVIKVADSHAELARLADRFYGHPSSKLGVIGVTGTNGKTTVSHMIQAVLSSAGFSASCLGTIEYRFPDETFPAPNTTPESLELQKLFSKAGGYKNPRCVMEVSSHGIKLGRLKHSSFKGGVFTNLTQDHLDFHSSMQDYSKTKQKFFKSYNLEYSVINIDDATGEKWVKEGMEHKVITYGFSEDADIRLLHNESDWSGNRLTLSTPVGEIKVETPMAGVYNSFNVMAAVGVAVAEEIELSPTVDAIRSLKSVPGRFERLDRGQPFAVVIDYAHTDNALASLLSGARKITSGKIICMFGCGGDRDRQKRKMMGQVADEMADIVVITSDNPRTEDPKKIIDEILEGVKNRESKRLMVIESREEAIKQAIILAQPDDTVILAGKGHEDYQIIGKKRIHFDDREVAIEVLEEIA